MDSKKTYIESSDKSILPSKWPSVKLKDFVYIKARIGWKGLKKSEFGARGYVIINGPNINHGKVNWESCERVPEWRYLESKEIAVSEGDILLTKDGTIGKVAFVDILEEPATLASGIFLLRPRNDTKLDARFLYAYLSSSSFKRLVEGRIEGSVVPHLYQRDIEELELPLPSLNEQKLIAKMLSALDSKIELNQQMNKTLESIAQTIFKHWFIKFEFPDEDGNPYKSSGGEMVYAEGLRKEIPSSCRVGKLSEISNIRMGQSPPGNTYNEIGNGTPLYQGIRDFGFRFPSKRVFCTSPTRLADDGDILLSVRAPIGSLNIATEKCCIGRGVSSIRHKENYQSFLYYLLISTKENWSSFEAEGTVFGAVTKSDVNDLAIIIPPSSVQGKFNSLIAPIDYKIRLNEMESRELSEIRESLLPKLMSGKIRVPRES